jgi:hypothetical protein
VQRPVVPEDDPGQHPGERNRGHSWAERRARTADVVEYLVALASDGQVRKMLRDKWGITGRKAADRELARARDALRAQDAAAAETERPIQVEGLKAEIRRIGARIIEAEKVGKQPVGLYQVLFRARELLSKITGTEQPAQLDVRVRMDVQLHDSLVGTMASLDEAQAAALIAEQQELERLAAERRAELVGEVVSATPAEKRLPGRESPESFT